MSDQVIDVGALVALISGWTYYGERFPAEIRFKDGEDTVIIGVGSPMIYGQLSLILTTTIAHATFANLGASLDAHVAKKAAEAGFLLHRGTNNWQIVAPCPITAEKLKATVQAILAFEHYMSALKEACAAGGWQFIGRVITAAQP